MSGKEESCMSELKDEEVKKMMDFIKMDDFDFFLKYLENASLEEIREFLKEFPEFPELPKK